MKNEKSFDEKLKEAETFLPGIREHLNFTGAHTPAGSFTAYPKDVETVETDTYRVVAAKWEGERWKDLLDFMPGINIGYGLESVDCSGWLSVHYQHKNGDGDITSLTTDPLQTRKYLVETENGMPLKGRFRNDTKTDHYPFEYVSLRHLGGDRIVAAWVDAEGDTGPKYKMDLGQESSPSA